MKRVLIPLMVVMVFVGVSCGDKGDKNENSIPVGSLGFPCIDIGDGICVDDLVCEDGICVVDESGDTGNTGDIDSIDDTDIDDTESDLINDLDDDTGVMINDDDFDTNIDNMVDVPEGEFQMGCNEAVDDQCDDHESPYHAVTLSAYKIDKYEVTVGEYQKCIDAGNCNNNDGDELHYYTTKTKSSCDLGATGKGDHPMQCVSWYGAKAYCAWAGKRLPTEAEWEKAARGTEGAKYPWGNEPEVSCEYAIMHDSGTNIHGCGKDSTWVVGSKEQGKSLYGAYDMVGNVWEWTNDWYDSHYYDSTPSEDPAGPESGVVRILRGGSWVNPRGALRTSNRFGSLPDEWDTYYGFRCAK